MEVIEIGGRKLTFTGESTARHDMWTMRQIAACGLNTLMQGNGETEEQFMVRLYSTALQSGDFFLLLGCLLIPEEVKPSEWSTDLAKQTAEFLASITNPEDKAKLRILLASGLMPFFQAGLRSSKISLKSSPHQEIALPHIVNAASKNMEIGD
jgi:hypothetical protein